MKTLAPLLSVKAQLGLTAAVLVSIPVFVQAPLVRNAPWVSLVLTLGWLALSMHLMSEPRQRAWGSLLYGFTLTWLAGSLYWGWLRADPLWHIPVEALGLPLAWWSLRQPNSPTRLGTFFYLGSLFGTVVTDLYIHSVGLLSEWRLVMAAPVFDSMGWVLGSALSKMQSPLGILWAWEACLLLFVAGVFSLRRQSTCWKVFGGAVLSTLVVDGLFWWGSSLVATGL
ncbi:MAG: DUF3120 domain-containing protein [Cyanophyceae cyanobacterium]